MFEIKAGRSGWLENFSKVSTRLERQDLDISDVYLEGDRVGLEI